MGTEYSHHPKIHKDYTDLINRLYSEEILVEITNDKYFLDTGGYLENGMRAVIKSMEIDDSNKDNIIYIFVFDYSKNLLLNKLQESRSYNTPDGMKTASEIGMIPDNCLDCAVLPANSNESFFKIIDDAHTFFKNQFSNLDDEGMSYVEWLEYNLSCALETAHKMQ